MIIELRAFAPTPSIFLKISLLINPLISVDYTKLFTCFRTQFLRAFAPTSNVLSHSQTYNLTFNLPVTINIKLLISGVRLSAHEVFLIAS